MQRSFTFDLSWILFRSLPIRKWLRYMAN